MAHAVHISCSDLTAGDVVKYDDGFATVVVAQHEGGRVHLVLKDAWGTLNICVRRSQTVLLFPRGSREATVNQTKVA